ncbi:MAG: glycosyltransferase family 9 protein [Ignavibacteriales bacterium]
MKRIEIFIKNIFLKILLLLKSGSHRNISPVFNRDSKILFIRLNRIGDALVVTPLLRQIKQSLGCKVHLLAAKSNYFVFNHNPGIDKVVVFNKGLNGFFEVLDYIRREKFDAVVDLHDDVSTTVTYLMAMCSAANKFGLEKGNGIVYTRTVEKLDAANHHVIDRILEMGKLFNLEIKKEDANVVYCPEENSVAEIKKVLSMKFQQKKFLIGINISAGSDARFWGIDRYKLLLQFLSVYDINVILLCSPRDIKYGETIVDGNSDMLFYTPSFDEFAAMISQLDLLFTPDTSTVHLASAYQVPVFGLYVHYNTNDMIWSPYKSDFDCVITKKPNLEDVTYTQVITQFQPFLEKYLI